MKCYGSLQVKGSQLAKMEKYIPINTCHKIDREEVVDLKNANYTLKITIIVNMWNLGQFCENDIL